MRVSGQNIGIAAVALLQPVTRMQRASGDVSPGDAWFPASHMLHTPPTSGPGGCAEFFNVLFMGMLAGNWYPAERDNLHLSGCAREARVSDSPMIVERKTMYPDVPLARTHFSGFWGGGCARYLSWCHHSVNELNAVIRAQSARTVVAATAASCAFAVALLPLIHHAVGVS